MIHSAALAVGLAQFFSNTKGANKPVSLAEKLGYLRGLADGLNLDAAKDQQGKLLAALVETVEELADQTSAQEEAIKGLHEQLDELTESLDVLETLVVDSFEDEEDEEEYEVECPNCGGAILLDGETLESGVVTCPSCEKKFEIDLGFE